MTRPRKLPSHIVCPQHGGSFAVERVAVSAHDDGTWHIYAFAFCPGRKSDPRHEIANHVRKTDEPEDQHALRGDEPEPADAFHRPADTAPAAAGLHDERRAENDQDEF